jgi:hypothetical protein
MEIQPPRRMCIVEVCDTFGGMVGRCCNACDQECIERLERSFRRETWGIRALCAVFALSVGGLFVGVLV